MLTASTWSLYRLLKAKEGKARKPTHNLRSLTFTKAPKFLKYERYTCVSRVRVCSSTQTHEKYERYAYISPGPAAGAKIVFQYDVTVATHLTKKHTNFRLASDRFHSKILFQILELQ